MKYSKSAIGLLTREYRSVLKKCLLINLGLFALGAIATPAMAETHEGHTGDSGVLNIIDKTVVMSGEEIFQNNTSTSHGAGLYSKVTTAGTESGATFNGNVTFNNNEVLSTATSGSGAGAFVSGGNVSFLGANNSFTNNHMNATIVSSRQYKVGGGAVANQSYADEHDGTAIDSTMVIGTANSTNTFSGNTSSTNGGAVMNRAVDTDGNATLTINGATTFESNTATMNGGAIYNNQKGDGHTATLNMNNGSYTFSGNTATKDGGAIYNSGILTASNGTFNNNTSGKRGGAIFSLGATTTVGGTFTGNTAVETGGAINSNKTNLTVLDGSSFTSNRGKNGSGAIHINNGGTANTVNIGNNVSFTNNTAGYDLETGTEIAPSTSVRRGGAVTIDGIKRVEIGNNAIFSGNKATGSGGAIHLVQFTDADGFNIGSNAKFLNNSVINNAIGIYGGAVSVAQNKNLKNTHIISFADTTFEGNEVSGTVDNLAQGVGGAVGQADGSLAQLNFTNSTFKSNTAGAEGGAISSDAVLNVTGSTFAENKTTGTTIGESYADTNEGGGAIFLYDQSHTTVKGSTFSNNTSGTFGGAISTRGVSNGAGGSNTSLTIEDSSFIGNSAVKGGAIASAVNTTIKAIEKDVIFSDNKASGVANDIYMANTDTSNHLLTLNAASGRTISLGGGLDGNRVYNVALTGAGSVDITGAVKNANISVNNGELHLGTGSSLEASTINVAADAIINTIDNVINDYSESITLADGAKIKGDIDFMNAKSDLYAANAGATVNYSIANLIGATGQGTKEIQVASNGAMVEVSDGIFDSSTGLTAVSSGATDGKIKVTGLTGGIEAAADASENVSYIQYNLTDDEDINTAKEIKDNFVLNGDGVGADDKGVTLNADLGVANGADLALNNLKLDGSAALNNDERGTLRINDSQIGVKVNNAGILISDPTTYNNTVNNYAGAYASFDHDTFNAELANSGTVDLNTVTFNATTGKITGNGVTNLVSGTTTFNNTANSNTINVANGAGWSGIINGGTVNTQNGAIETTGLGSVSDGTNLYVDANLAGAGSIDAVTGGTIKSVKLANSAYGDTNAEVTLAGNYDTNVEVDGFSYYTNVEKTAAGLKFSDKLVNTSGMNKAIKDRIQLASGETYGDDTKAYSTAAADAAIDAKIAAQDFSDYAKKTEIHGSGTASAPEGVVRLGEVATKTVIGNATNQIFISDGVDKKTTIGNNDYSMTLDSGSKKTTIGNSNYSMTLDSGNKKAVFGVEGNNVTMSGGSLTASGSLTATTLTATASIGVGEFSEGALTKGVALASTGKITVKDGTNTAKYNADGITLTNGTNSSVYGVNGIDVNNKFTVAENGYMSAADGKFVIGKPSGSDAVRMTMRGDANIEGNVKAAGLKFDDTSIATGIAKVDGETTEIQLASQGYVDNGLASKVNSSDLGFNIVAAAEVDHTNNKYASVKDYVDSNDADTTYTAGNGIAINPDTNAISVKAGSGLAFVTEGADAGTLKVDGLTNDHIATGANIALSKLATTDLSQFNNTASDFQSGAQVATAISNSIIAADTSKYMYGEVKTAENANKAVSAGALTQLVDEVGKNMKADQLGWNINVAPTVDGSFAKSLKSEFYGDLEGQNRTVIGALNKAGDEIAANTARFEDGATAGSKLTVAQSIQNRILKADASPNIYKDVMTSTTYDNQAVSAGALKQIAYQVGTNMQADQLGWDINVAPTSTDSFSQKLGKSEAEDLYDSLTGTNRTVVGALNTAGDAIVANTAAIAALADTTKYISVNNVSYVGEQATKDKATATGDDAVAVGLNTIASGASSAAFGDYANATGQQSIAIGNGAKAQYVGAIAIGGRANVATTASNATAIGNDAKAEADLAVALGQAADAKALASVSIGNSSKAQAATSVALGHEADAQGESAISIGTSTEAATTAVALGHNATASAVSSLAFGTNSNASKVGALALGQGSIGSGDYSVAMGLNSVAGAVHAVALGVNASATAENAVALGGLSTTAEANTVSVGNADLKRRIVNVAAGTADTDAVNYKQLTDGLATKYNFSAIVGTPATETADAETINANTPVYSKNATDALINGITTEAGAAWNKAETWMNTALGIDSKTKDADKALQAALGTTNYLADANSFSQAIKTLDGQAKVNADAIKDRKVILGTGENEGYATIQDGSNSVNVVSAEKANAIYTRAENWLKGVTGLNTQNSADEALQAALTAAATADGKGNNIAATNFAGALHELDVEKFAKADIVTTTNNLASTDATVYSAAKADAVIDGKIANSIIAADADKYMYNEVQKDENAGKSVSAGALTKLVGEVGFNMKQDQLGWDINVDTSDENSFSEKLNSAMYNGLTKKTTERTVVSALNTVGNAFEDKLDGETVIGKKTVVESIQDALSDPEQDITADDITANSVDTQSLKVAVPAEEEGEDDNVIFEAKAGATADDPNVINLNGKTTVEGGLNVDSITMGEKTVNAISSDMINSTNHNASTLATTEAVYAALGKVDKLITKVDGKAKFDGNQGEGYPTLSTFNNNAEGEYRGNLAVGTTVAQDLIELDNVFGMMQDLDETNNLKAYKKATGAGNVAENLTALDSAIGDVDFSNALIAEVKAATNATDAILALDGYLHIDTGLWNNINALTNNNDKQSGTTATNIGTAIQYLGWRVDDINDHKKMTLATDGKTALIQDDKIVDANEATFYTKDGADAAFMAKDATIDTTNLSSGVVTSLGKADTALQANDITSGTANGTIKVKGTDVAVAGLGSAAFTDTDDYATAAQGALAASSLQGIKDGSEGYITVDDDSNKLIVRKVALANLASDVTATSIADGGTGFTTSDQVYDALADKADATDLADYMKTADYTNSETVSGTTTTYLNADKFKDGSIAQAKVAGLTDDLAAKADTDLSNITNAGKGVINDLADARIVEAKATSLESTSSTKLATEGQVVTALASKADTGLSNITEAGENKIKSLSTTAMEDKIATYNTSTNPAEKTVYSAASIKDALDKAGTALQADSALNGAMISAGTVAEGSLAAPVVAKLAKAENSVQGIEAGGENFVTLSANNKLVISKITESHIASSAFDSAPTANSSKLLTSGAVAQAISAYTIKSADVDEFNVSDAGVLSVKKIASSKIDGLGTAAAADIKTSIGSTVADTADDVVVSEKAIRTALDLKLDAATLDDYKVKDVDADGTILLDNTTGKIKVGTIGLANIEADAFGDIEDNGTTLVKSGTIYTYFQNYAKLGGAANFSSLTLGTGTGLTEAKAISNGDPVSLTATNAADASTLATNLTVKNTVQAAIDGLADVDNVAHDWKEVNTFEKKATFKAGIDVIGTVDATTVDTENLKVGDATVSSIDKGATAVAVGAGDATKLATTATVMKSSENATFTAPTGDAAVASLGSAATIHDAIVNVGTVVDDVNDKIGSMTFTGPNVDATNTDDLTSAVNQLDGVIGNIAGITAGYAQNANGSDLSSVSEAINNVALAAAQADGSLVFTNAYTTSEGTATGTQATNLTDAINNVARNAAAAAAGISAEIHGTGTEIAPAGEVKVGNLAATTTVGTVDSNNKLTGMKVSSTATVDTDEDGTADSKALNIAVSGDGRSTNIDMTETEASMTATNYGRTVGMLVTNNGSDTHTVSLGEDGKYVIEIDTDAKTTKFGKGDGKEVVIGEGDITADKSVTVGSVEGAGAKGVKLDATDGSITSTGNATVGGNLAVKGNSTVDGVFRASEYHNTNDSFYVTTAGGVTASSVRSSEYHNANDSFYVTSGGALTASEYHNKDNSFFVTTNGGVTGSKLTSNGALNVAGKTTLSADNGMAFGEGQTVKGIDNGATPVTGNGSAETLATTATVMTSAEKAKYTNNGTGVVNAKGSATLHDAIQVLDNAMGTMDLSSSTTKTFVDTTTTSGFVENATDGLLALDTIVGNITDLDGTTKGNLDGPNKSVAEHLTALDARLGEIKAIDGGVGNLAGDNSDVATHFNSLDVAMGNRTNYKNNSGSNGYVATNDGSKDLTTMISEVASNIGEFKETYSTNLISSEQTVNANLSALDGAIGNMTFAEDITADDLTSVINNVDAKLNHSNEVFSKAINQLDYNYRELRHDFEAGMASQAALSALVPNGRAKGDTQLSVGTGMYKGHTAAAVGGFHWFTDNLLFNAGVAWDNAEATGRMGVTYSW